MDLSSRIIDRIAVAAKRLEFLEEEMGKEMAKHYRSRKEYLLEFLYREKFACNYLLIELRQLIDNEADNNN